MKKAMLFAITLLFSFNANAATITIVNDVLAGGASFNSFNFNNGPLAVASYSAVGDFTIGNQVTVDEDTNAVIEWSFNPEANLTGAEISEGGDFDLITAITGDYKFSMFLQAGVTYFFDIIGNVNPAAGIQLSVQAVPVPAALWLLAPALMGFFGLRRRSNGLAAA